MSLEQALYLMGICGDLKGITLFFGAFGLLICVTIILYTLSDHVEPSHGKYVFPKFAKWSVPLSMFLLFVSILIPRETTIRNIIAVRFIKENKEQITRLPTEIKEYILDFAKDLKGALKEEIK